MEGIRTCWNYKSRGHPDVPCVREALFGDFCSYHYKFPHRHVVSRGIRRLWKRKQSCLKRFVRFWRFRVGLSIARRQGPVGTSEAINRTELISMEPVETIYPPYRFSFYEFLPVDEEGKNYEKGRLWVFDVRALLSLRQTMRVLHNPYTLSVLPEDILARLHDHVNWLTQRRYMLNYPTALPVPTQQQAVTSLCLLMDSYGYWTNVDWFCSMTVQTIHDFVNCLDALWMEGLGLTYAQRCAIYPPWNPDRLFLVPALRQKRLAPLLDQLIAFLITFMKAAADRELRALACVYILKALAATNTRVLGSYPWL